MTVHYCDMCKKRIYEGIDFFSVTINEITIHNAYNKSECHEFCTDCIAEIKKNAHETILSHSVVKDGEQE